MTWIFDGYEVSILSLASLDLQKEFGITSVEIGYIASSYLIGCCVGALLFGYLASKFGRKTLFSVTLIIYIMSVVVQCFANHYYHIIICRTFTGVAVGGEYTAIFAAIDELIPVKERGRVDIIIDGTWYNNKFV